MNGNLTKCKVLHVGNKNIRQDCFMGGTKLECAQLEIFGGNSRPKPFSF